MSIDRRRRSPRRRWWPYLLLLLIAGGLFALPYAAERWIRNTLDAHYAGRATLGGFSLQPWNGVLRLSGLRIDAEDGPLLVLDSLELDADLLPLLSGRLDLARLAVEGLRLTLEMGEDGRWRLDGRLLVQMPGAALGLSVQTAALGDLTLQLNGPQWRHEVSVSQAHISDLATLGAVSGDVIIDGRIDGAPVRVSARMAHGGERSDAAGRIDIDDLDLAALSHLGLTGRALLQGRVEAGFDLSLDGSGGIELAGQSQVTRGMAQFGTLRSGAGTIDWNGTVQLARNGGWRVGLLGELAAGALHHRGFAEADQPVETGVVGAFDASGLSWKGNLEFDLAAGTTRIRQRGDGELTGLLHRVDEQREQGAARLRWDGDLLVDRAATPDWRLRYDGKLSGERWRDGAATLERLQWDGSLRAARKGSEPPAGELDGKLILAATLAGDGWSLETGNTTWQGRGEWQGGSPESTLRLDADMDGEGLAFRHEALDLNARVSAFAIDGGPMTVTFGGGRTALRQDAELSLGSSMVAGGFGQLMMHEGVLWEGPLALTTTPDEPFAADARGRFTSPAGELALADSGLTVSQARLDWDGLLHYQATRGVLEVDGGLLLIAPSVVAQAPRGVLFDAIDLAVGTLSASLPGGLEAGDVVVTTPRLSSSDVDRPEAATVVGDRLSLSALEWLPGSRLRVGEVDMEGFRGRLVRAADGLQLPLPFGFGETVAGPEARPVWSLDRLTLAPGARLTFLDRVVRDGFQADLILERGELAGLDSGDPGAVASATLEARQGDYTTLSLTGMLSAAPESAGGVVHGKLRDVDMTLLSPYSVELLGHRIRYGQGDADLQWSFGAEGARLRQDLSLRTLSVAPVAGEVAGRIESRLGMSMPDALARIRDDHGDIDLQITLAGDTPAGENGSAFRDALLRAIEPETPSLTELPPR